MFSNNQNNHKLALEAKTSK